MGDDAPKSALELAMERLKQKDRAEGFEERPLTDEQRGAIAEVRKVYEARLAESEILNRSERARAADYETLERLDEEYRRDRERLVSERERKLDELRRGG